MVIRFLLTLALIFGAQFAIAKDSSWPMLPKEASAVASESLQTGIFYFHYLNQDYQASANELQNLRAVLPAEKQTELDILEVTLLLALGIEHQATEIFERINIKDEASSRAWLFMARRWIARGHWENAQFSALQSLQNPEMLTVDQEQEALYILTLSAIELEEYARARNYFERMEPYGHWAELARFNVFVATIKGSSSSYAIETSLAEIQAYSRGKTAASKALVDRAFLLAGLYMLEENRNKAAESLFQKIRQDSPYAPESLLFYGWSMSAQSRYYDAIQPWRVLQQEYEDWHPAVIESIVAVPHTMEMMNATTQALRGYEIVEETITQLLKEVDELQQPIVMQTWLRQWLEQQEGDWGWRRHEVSIEQSSITQSLSGLMATTKFRENLSELYDLYVIQTQLQAQFDQTELWKEMVSQRQQKLQQVDGTNRYRSLQQRHTDLLQQIESLESQWRQQELEQYPYLTPLQKVQIQQLDRVVDNVKFLQEVNTPTRNLAAYKERWRRNRGVYLWQITADQSAREWASTREFWNLYSVIQEMNIKLRNSGLALEWSDSSWVGLEDKIHSIQERIVTLQKLVAEQQENQENHLIAEMTGYLQDFSTRLFKYQSHARLATARLYDDALQLKLISTLQEQAEEFDD